MHFQHEKHESVCLSDFSNTEAWKFPFLLFTIENIRFSTFVNSKDVKISFSCIITFQKPLRTFENILQMKIKLENNFEALFIFTKWKTRFGSDFHLYKRKKKHVFEAFFHLYKMKKHIFEAFFILLRWKNMFSKRFACL